MNEKEIGYELKELLCSYGLSTDQKIAVMKLYFKGCHAAYGYGYADGFENGEASIIYPSETEPLVD